MSTSALCPSYIGARTLRVTRLDRCGRPLYTDRAQGVSNGFVSINFDPEVQEGEDYTLRNANGDLCVNDRGKDALQWINVQIEFCRVDADLWQAMNPSWDTVENARGQVTGFRIGEEISDDTGFALEVWPKVSGNSVLCDDEDVDGDPPTGYFLLPYVISRAPEGWSLENGTATFTLNARTRVGSQWGRGPHNVTRDINGNPTPLLKPISSGAENSKPHHFHADVVPLSPPEPFCGLKPLEALPPGVEGEQVTVEADQQNQACLTVSGSPGRQATIDWGDGSSTVTTRVGREECRLYSEVGTYTVTVSDIEDPTKTKSYEVDIEEVPALPAPGVQATQSSGVAPFAAQLKVDNHDHGEVSIDWGDGTPVQTREGNAPEGGPAIYPHQYHDEGSHTVTVTAVADSRAEATVDIEVVGSNPVVGVAPLEGEAPLTVQVTVDNHGRGPVTLSWGDGLGDSTNLGNGISISTHSYQNEGEYTVLAVSRENGEDRSEATVTVTAGDIPDPELTVTPASGEAGVTVFEALADNHGNGDGFLDWGDGSDPVPDAGNGTSEVTHTYTDPGEYTVTWTSAENSGRSAEQTITVNDAV